MLTQQGLKKALKEEKSQDMTYEDYEDLDERVMSMIHLSIANEILSNVLDEKITKSMWGKLGSLYMTKSLSNKLSVKK